MNFSQPQRSKDLIAENPIGLSREQVERVIPELDHHLASLFLLFHQYQKHHWLVEGPQFRDLHLFLEESYKEIHASVDLIAERITALGGIPVSHPSSLVERSYLEHEPEGYYLVRDMLEHDRRAEGEMATRLRQTITHCTKVGDFGTEQILKGVLLQVEDRAHHLDHFLAEDSLEVQRETV